MFANVRSDDGLKRAAMADCLDDGDNKGRHRPIPAECATLRIRTHCERCPL